MSYEVCVFECYLLLCFDTHAWLIGSVYVVYKVDPFQPYLYVVTFDACLRYLPFF